MSQFVQLKTTEGTNLYVRPGNIGAIEEIPQSSRGEAQVKMYISGYKFSLRGTVEQVLNALGGVVHAASPDPSEADD